MKTKLAIILLIALTASALAASVPPLHKNQSFLIARKALLKARWQPIPMHVHDDDVYEGVEKQLARQGIKEFDSCSIDSSRCILYYRRGSQCLRLDTIGEQLAMMKVVQWAEACPAPQN